MVLLDARLFASYARLNAFALTDYLNTRKILYLIRTGVFRIFVKLDFIKIELLCLLYFQNGILALIIIFIYYR